MCKKFKEPYKKVVWKVSSSILPNRKNIEDLNWLVGIVWTIYGLQVLGWKIKPIQTFWANSCETEGVESK